MSRFGRTFTKIIMPRGVKQVEQDNRHGVRNIVTTLNIPMNTVGVGPCVAVGVNAETGRASMAHLDSESDVDTMVGAMVKSIGDPDQLISFVAGGNDVTGAGIFEHVCGLLDTPTSNTYSTRRTGECIDVYYEPATQQVVIYNQNKPGVGVVKQIISLKPA